MFQTAFQEDAVQVAPLAFQVDKPREDTDKDKDKGSARVEPAPSGGVARSE